MFKVISQAIFAELLWNRVKKEKKYGSILTGETRSDDVFCQAAGTMEELATRLGRKWKSNAQQLAILAEAYLPLAGDTEGENPVMAIASTSRLLRRALRAADAASKAPGKKGGSRLSKSGCTSKALRLIPMARKVGLLVCVDEGYSPGWREEGTSRRYVLNRRLAKMLVKEFGHASPPADSKVLIGSEVNDVLQRELPQAAFTPDVLLGAVRFNSKLRLPSSLTNTDIARALLQRYPTLAHYRELAADLNEWYYKDWPELQIRFEPSVSRSENYVTGIGIRAYSPICSYPKEAADGCASRKCFFESYFGPEAKVDVYDVRSSIYRVAFFLNKGKWLNDAQDLYGMMCPLELARPEDRELYKKLAMSLYFSGSPRQVAANMMNRVPRLKGICNLEVLTEWASLMQEAMFSVVGTSIDSEIFLHESCIYLDLHKFLTDKGLKVVQVYDAFYSDDPRLKELCREALPKIAAAYANEWLKPSQEGGATRMRP